MSIFKINHFPRTRRAAFWSWLQMLLHRIPLWLCWTGMTVDDYLQYKLSHGKEDRGEICLDIIGEFKESFDEDEAYRDIFDLPLTSHVGMMVKEVLDAAFLLCSKLENPPGSLDRAMVIQAAVNACGAYTFS